MSAQNDTTKPAADETTDLSKQYDTPLGLAHTTMQALKDRIKLHYDLASDYYLNLWGEHIHHGYWPTPSSKATDTKETAQLNLIHLLLSTAQLEVPAPSSSLATTTTAAGSIVSATDGPGAAGQPQLRVLDVGCGVGGTTRYLASALGASVTGITISGKQVAIARRLSLKTAGNGAGTGGDDDGKGIAGDAQQQQQQQQQQDGGAVEREREQGFIGVGAKGGRVRFLELDAEKMGEYFSGGGGGGGGKNVADGEEKDGDGGEKAGGFDIVWISEALSHFPNKALFFRNAQQLLRPGGKLVLADWFKQEGLSKAEFEADVKPIEDGMLLPPLCTQQEYVDLATTAGLKVLSPPKDISADVSKTWDISWSLVQNPSLWAFAFSQGRDGIAFLQAFRAMRRGYANGSFRYAVMSFAKP